MAPPDWPGGSGVGPPQWAPRSPRGPPAAGGCRTAQTGRCSARLSDQHRFCVLVHTKVGLGLGNRAATSEEQFKLLVALDDEGIENHQVLTFLSESFLAGCELKDLRNTAKISPLVVVQVLVNFLVYHVEPLWGHNCRVDVSVVNQITNNFQ